MNLTNGKTRSFNLRTRYHETTKHSQICVTGILNLLKKVVPDDARCLVALTMYDLYGDDPDLFIAGLAMGNCRVAAFSLYRYDPYLTFSDSDWFDYQLKSPSESNAEIVERRNLLLLRASRLLTHEICHLFGIAHCIFYSCLLNGSGDLGKTFSFDTVSPKRRAMIKQRNKLFFCLFVEEDFSQPLFECPIDLRKLYTLINFNISKRYEELCEFFQMHNFLDEMKIAEIKLNLMKQFNPSSSSIGANSSTSSISTEKVKRKCTYSITTRKSAREATADDDEIVSQLPVKHLKAH